MMQPMLRKTGVLLLAGLALTLGVPGPCPLKSATAAENAPTDKPKIWLSPEIEIKPEPKKEAPVKTEIKPEADAASKDPKKEKPGWFSRNKWWVLLGVVATGAAAALAAGGGSSGSGGEEGGTGTYDSSW